MAFNNLPEFFKMLDNKQCTFPSRAENVYTKYDTWEKIIISLIQQNVTHTFEA